MRHGGGCFQRSRCGNAARSSARAGRLLPQVFVPRGERCSVCRRAELRAFALMPCLFLPCRIPALRGRGLVVHDAALSSPVAHGMGRPAAALLCACKALLPGAGMVCRLRFCCRGNGLPHTALIRSSWLKKRGHRFTARHGKATSGSQGAETPPCLAGCFNRKRPPRRAAFMVKTGSLT